MRYRQDDEVLTLVGVGSVVECLPGIPEPQYWVLVGDEVVLYRESEIQFNTLTCGHCFQQFSGGSDTYNEHWYVCLARKRHQLGLDRWGGD